MADLPGLIARARAAMMVRGYAPLVIVLGRQTAADLMRDHPGTIDDTNPGAPVMFDTPVVYDTAREGFAVEHRPGD